MIITNKLKMNLLSPGTTPLIHMIQDDSNSRQLEFLLYAGNTPFDPPVNTTAVIRYRKSDGTGGEYDTLPDGSCAWTFRGNSLTILLTAQVLSFPGNVDLTVTLIEGDRQLNTFPVLIHVLPVAHAPAARSENFFYVTGLLPAPLSAKSGQYLRISSVNSAGKVTGVEAVDLSITEGSQMDSTLIQQAVTEYLNENPPAPGEQGEAGISVTHEWNGTSLIITSASGTSSADLKGESGQQGPAGPQGEKGDKGDQGPQGEKGDSYVLTDSDKAEIASLIDGDSVPAYWQDALDAGAEAINTALLRAGYNKSAFLFYSDTHWNYGSQMSPRLLAYLYAHTGMTRTFFGGDIVNNEADDYDTMAYLWDWRKQLKGVPNHHSVVGNHDDGNATNNLFSEQYVYGYLLAAEETPDIVRGDSGLYYYVDSPAEKTRYLCLDTAYQGVGNDQQEFVKNALLTTPDGWHIVAVSHIWHDTNYNVTPPAPGDINSGASVLLTMFESYNSRSGNYADCGGQVEFCIGGHTHWDYDSTSTAGIPIILVETDSKHVRSGLGFTAGTTTEAAVNGIIADYDNHVVHVVRVGRGESRDVELTCHTASYTNLLDEIGFEADQEYSTSSGTQRASSSGFDLTGWIALTGGETYYLKNFIMPDGVADRNNMAYYFNSDKSWGGSFCLCTTHADGKNWNPVFGEDGNLAQFTIPSGYTGTYLRINCTQIDETSILTRNEPIT